jgi:hypothetical protein
MKSLVGLIFSSLLFVLCFGSTVGAQSSEVIITEIRLGGVEIENGGVKLKQYITLHNPTDQMVNLDGWRLQYAKSTYAGSCQAVSWPESIQLAVSLQAGAFVTIPYQLTDNAAGSVRIIDTTLVVHDMVGWGNAPCYEKTPVAQVPSNDKSILRYLNCDGTFAGSDTDNNAADFLSNQVSFGRIVTSGCMPVCTDAQQLIDMECVDDQCANLPDFYAIVPSGYYRTDGACIYLPDLVISELLPNPKGSDIGNEYIELYNPSDVAVNLRFYRLIVGDSSTYSLFDYVLQPGGFALIKNSEIKFTLTNTKSRVILQTVGGDIVSQTDYYESAPEGEAWALIDGSWQYTNRPTPGDFNLASVIDDEVETGLKPCASNQYRHPDTNRCRLLVTTAGTLTPCKDGQYRSEETNRCRNIASAGSTLVPCKVGQYRSEETNRCRSIASDASTLTPCKEGQERNPATNRCRNVPAVLGDMSYAAEPIAQRPEDFMGWWVLSGIGLMALARIVWEWRHEIGRLFGKATARLPFRK